MSFPKFQYIRSKKLMEAYRAIPCQHCGRDDGTVCGAHSNQSCHGKGRSIKASDVFAASLCSICHWMLDQSGLDRHEAIEMWGNAWRKTIKALVLGGHWPESVPIPDVRIFH